MPRAAVQAAGAVANDRRRVERMGRLSGTSVDGQVGNSNPQSTITFLVEWCVRCGSAVTIGSTFILLTGAPDDGGAGIGVAFVEHPGQEARGLCDATRVAEADPTVREDVRRT